MRGGALVFRAFAGALAVLVCISHVVETRQAPPSRFDNCVGDQPGRRGSLSKSLAVLVCISHVVETRQAPRMMFPPTHNDDRATSR